MTERARVLEGLVPFGAEYVDVRTTQSLLATDEVGQDQRPSNLIAPSDSIAQQVVMREQVHPSDELSPGPHLHVRLRHRQLLDETGDARQRLSRRLGATVRKLHHRTGPAPPGPSRRPSQNRRQVRSIDTAPKGGIRDDNPLAERLPGGDVDDRPRRRAQVDLLVLPAVSVGRELTRTARSWPCAPR